MNLRLATLDDIDTLVPLVGAYHELDGVESTDPARRATIEPLLREGSARGRIWLIEISNGTVGYITGFDALKQALLTMVLRLRQDQSALWEHGIYEPVAAEGSRSGHVVAFARRYGSKMLLVAGLLHCAPVLIEAGAKVPQGSWWDAAYLLPADGPPMEGAALFENTPTENQPQALFD